MQGTSRSDWEKRTAYTIQYVGVYLCFIITVMVCIVRKWRLQP